MAREINIELINKVIEQITTHFRVDKIILFGSYAKGTAHDESDVDIAVISSEFTAKSVFANVRKIKEKIQLFEPYLQLFAFSSQDFNEETFIDPSFIREIKRTGRILFSANQP